jgi:lactate racemase
MKIKLKYGLRGLNVNLPETPGFVGVLEPKKTPVLRNAKAMLAKMLREPISSPPLAEIAAGKKSACIVVSDITRPVPNATLLAPILKVLDEAGIAGENILILIATGTHRPNEGAEAVHLLGEDILRDYRVANHFCKREADMAYVGKIGGDVPVYVNRQYLDADLKILTGFIEPHMWAGFSGGRKAILPGISSMETVKYMHGPQMVAHGKVAYGVLEGNPFHEAALDIMNRAGADFLVNVTLSLTKKITGIFAGHPVQAHLRGCEFLAAHCIHTFDEPLDFIVTTQAGAPADCNLYQTVKSMVAATPGLKRGGVVLTASACYEGVGNPECEEVFNMVDTPQRFLERLMDKDWVFIPDQWCAQEVYQVMRRNPTWIYTDGVPREKLERYHFRCVDSVEKGVADLLERFGKQHARWAVVPDGPMLILRTRGSTTYGHK